MDNNTDQQQPEVSKPLQHVIDLFIKSMVPSFSKDSPLLKLTPLKEPQVRREGDDEFTYRLKPLSSPQ